MRRSYLRQLLADFALLALPQVAGAQAALPPLRVVATFSVLADMVREVGGPAVDVASLVGPNADAHVFAPTPADARRVASAELVVVNGLNYEGWIERLIRASGYKGPVLVASESITPRCVGRGIDPHAWQSLAHAKQYVENIRAALVAAAPTRRAEIDTRAAAYLQRITALEQDTLARIGRLPAQQRRVITAHDAFGYFAAAYGVEFVSPRGWSTDSEPSADALARIVRQARAQQVGALLLENISDPRLIERIAREAGVGVGGALYSDALSPPGTAADTYLRMFAHNVRTIVEALEQARPAAFAKP
jgi:zinc/manganese transport system substrate-binding protein